MSGTKQIQASLTPVGLQRAIQSNSTAVSASATTKGARVLILSAEVQAMRFTLGTVVPTKNTGILLPINSPFVLSFYNGTSLLRFFRSTGASATIQIQGFKLT
jgi:hypothetical protein